jgi:uncharacterized 2Fe-2S/4Fe-4S cluster protein (DUF4445 family)
MNKSVKLSELNTNETIADFLRRQDVRVILPCGGMGSCSKCTVKVHFNGDGKILKAIEVLSCQTTAAHLFELAPAGCTEVTFEIDNSKILTCGPSTFSSENLTETASSDINPDTSGASPDKKINGKPYLAAVDLGSTTIETAVLTPDGELIGSVRKRNPQVSYGADVISRIKAAASSRIAASDMQRLAESTIAASLSELSSRYGLSKIPSKMAVAANTTMGHLLEGADVRSLGEAPFDPGDISLKDISRIFFTDKAPVYLLPGISTFVGGDIVSGIYYLGIDKADEPSLLIDLGTNGEMVLGNRDALYVTSTAAGPAFEAANISCGTPGLPGAITHVSFKGTRPVLTLIPWEDDLSMLSPGERMQQEIRLRSRRPLGLCGNGLISAVSAMRAAGIIDENGTFTRDEWIKKGFPLWRPSPANRGEDSIILTQDDIHELLFAKSAVRSGIEILMKRSHLTPSRVYLAGGFGSTLSADEAASIGLFPETLSGRTAAVGNTSLKGAVKFLSEDSPEVRMRLSQIRDKSHEIVLADDKDFEDLYLNNLRV